MKGAEDVYNSCVIVAVIVLWVASEVPINVPLRYWSNKQLWCSLVLVKIHVTNKHVTSRDTWRGKMSSTNEPMPK